MSDNDKDKEKLRKDLEKAVYSGDGSTLLRFLMAVVGGLVPLVGGVVGGAGGAWSERDQNKVNRLFEAWLKLQQEEMEEIVQTLAEVLVRLDLEDPAVQERIEGKEYLSLIKKVVRDWSAAESEEKRVLIRNLLSNAGAAHQLTSDDVIRMFIGWIEEYSEAHFAVIKAVYNTGGIARGGVWSKIHGEAVREDSAEADLFKLLFRDLSTGGVIRQVRPKDAYGNFLKKPQSGRRGTVSSRAMKSAFDDGDGYELTELGKQFVHYTMNEVVPKIAATASSSTPTGDPQV